jgi:hypothetical protein
MPEVYEFLEAERIKYAVRLPANQVLQGRIGYLLKRPAILASNSLNPVIPTLLSISHPIMRSQKLLPRGGHGTQVGEPVVAVGLPLSGLLTTNVPSRWRIASIAAEDALILPHRANPCGCDFLGTTSGTWAKLLCIVSPLPQNVDPSVIVFLERLLLRTPQGQHPLALPLL